MAEENRKQEAYDDLLSQIGAGASAEGAVAQVAFTQFFCEFLDDKACLHGVAQVCGIDPLELVGQVPDAFLELLLRHRGVYEVYDGLKVVLYKAIVQHFASSMVSILIMEGSIQKTGAFIKGGSGAKVLFDEIPQNVYLIGYVSFPD